MARKVSGRKRYRRILEKKANTTITPGIVKLGNNLEVFFSLADSKELNSLWTLSYLDNSTRTFLFKYHNNILGYNNAVAHFVRGHSPNCTFCDLTQNPAQVPETPLHLFYDCIVTEQIIINFFLPTNGG